MRKITLMAFLISLIGVAQVKGNKNIKTKTFSIKGLTALEMDIYAKVEIDQSAKEEMTITVDGNLMDLIDTEIVDGKMTLRQSTWIQPSKNIIVKIGMPNIKRVQVGVHETVVIKNINKDNISLMALNGKIIASGNANSAGIGSENGIIDARDLKTEKVYLNIWGNGKAIVNASDLIESTLGKDAKVELIGSPLKLRGDIKRVLAKQGSEQSKVVKWITFKIKNNSLNRRQFVVRGPKADGSKFGYGFPMMPHASRKERWSVGTKVYLKSKLGLQKLLVTIKPEDAGKTVKLFD